MGLNLNIFFTHKSCMRMSGSKNSPWGLIFLPMRELTPHVHSYGGGAEFQEVVGALSPPRKSWVSPPPPLPSLHTYDSLPLF